MSAAHFSKAIAGALAGAAIAFCGAMATAAADGHVEASEIWIAVGAAVGGSGIAGGVVAAAPKNRPRPGPRE